MPRFGPQMADFRDAPETILHSETRDDSGAGAVLSRRSLPQKLLIQMRDSGEPEESALICPVGRQVGAQKGRAG